MNPEFCQNVASQKKRGRAKTRRISSSARGSPRTPAANTPQQLNTILHEDNKNTHNETCLTRFGSSILSELQLVITSGHTQPPLVCLRSAEKPQKPCAGPVIDKSFRRSLDVKVNLFSVQTKTKTKPCEQQKRHCKKLGCFDYIWSATTAIF